MSRNYDTSRFYGQRPTLFLQPLSQHVSSALEDEEIALELDEPPDHHSDQLPAQVQNIHEPIMAKSGDRQYVRQPPTSLSRKCSLLTQGLVSSSSLQAAQPSNGLMIRAASQASAYSLSSNHGLTSDGGLSSPAHSGTPSPPLLAALENINEMQSPKIRTIKFAGERNAAPKREQIAEKCARKRCITFACGPSKTSTDHALKAVQGQTADGVKHPGTIKFACNSAVAIPLSIRPATPPRKQTLSDMQATPKRIASPFLSSRKQRGSLSASGGFTPDGEKQRAANSYQRSPSQMRKLEKERLKKLGSTRPEDEAWVNEIPKERKPITVTDTLRKENAIRQLAVEAEQEALDEALDDIIDDDEEEEEEDDELVTGSRYMAYDEGESDGGHETDDEGGFAESDDESDDDPDFQFWTTGHSTAATSADQHNDLIRPFRNRTVSESSFDSTFKAGSSSAMPMPARHRVPLRRKSPKAIKMRPGTPELPDSTDFVCGTLDEDRPLEEAYLSCLKQRQLERQGIIPQDLDPSFPTSDPENNDDEEDEVTEGVASTASDHHFLGGKFDESDSSQQRGRGPQAEDLSAAIKPRRLSSLSADSLFKPATAATLTHKAPSKVSPSVTAMQRLRTKSPAPVAMQRMRTKSPAPIAMQRVRTKSPLPIALQRPGTKSPGVVAAVNTVSDVTRQLFDYLPVRSDSPLQGAPLRSPPASPRNISIQTAGLAECPRHVETASLPHTPNPFFVIQERRLRANRKRFSTFENHYRGPIDIKQGLEQRKQRRKEHYWRKHCRDHKDRSRRCAPGKGAERMRELGLEMAHRNKAYGQKLQLMLSV